MVHCESQEEVDHFWKRLSEGGTEIQCGWLKDKYGLAWQIVPRRFFQLIESTDAAATQRVMKAMFAMKKFDIAALEQAYRGETQ